jgi:uncharacterized protein
MPLRLFTYISIILITNIASAQERNSFFKVLVLSESGGHHIEFTRAAKPWLNTLSKEKNFTIDYIENTATIDYALLSQYKLFIQLDYPPYGWSNKAVLAFEKYIGEGQGGWIGLHHASLLGSFDGYPMWNWFSNFMGGIEYVNYIPTFASGKVIVEDINHSCMKGVHPIFTVDKEEWYIYDKSPRKNVHVIASVDESSYNPSSDIKMGDHPVVWSNTNVGARNIYIFMGHSPDLLLNKDYQTLLRNSILWAAGY